MQNIARDEGGIRAFYRGLGPNIVGNSISWALYFVWYDRMKVGIQDYRGPGARLSYYDFFVASGAAGTFQFPTSTCAYRRLTVYMFRDVNRSVHESNMGDQDPHAVNIQQPPRSLHIHPRWHATDLSIRRLVRLLSRLGPFALWGLSWSITVHGIRTA